MQEDIYFTVDEAFEGEFKDKGSKFIAYAFPFCDEKDLKGRLEDVKSIHPKARHYCYAYRIGEYISRANDDGEPSGSAGKPILNVLLSKKISNVIVIVVRYFGGTLLGVPGLINAYKTATQEALNAATIIEKTIDVAVKLSFNINRMNDVMRYLKEFEAKIISQGYEDMCLIIFEIRTSKISAIVEKLQDFRDIKIEKLN